MNRMPLFVALVVLATTGCVGGSDAPSADDKRKLAAYELSAPPAQLPLRLNTDFDGKVVLVGAKVEPRGVVRPGQKLKLTLQVVDFGPFPSNDDPRPSRMDIDRHLFGRTQDLD